MPRTIDQRIAAKEAELIRLRAKQRANENGQKIIVGAMVINAAKEDPRMRRWLLDEAAKAVTREADQRRLAPLLAELSQERSDD